MLSEYLFSGYMKKLINMKIPFTVHGGSRGGLLEAGRLRPNKWTTSMY